MKKLLCFLILAPLLSPVLAQQPAFTIPLIGDVQFLSSSCSPNQLKDIPNDIASKRVSMNILFVATTGDSVDTANSTQYGCFDTNFLNIFNSAAAPPAGMGTIIPFDFPIGNHDYDAATPSARNTTNYDTYVLNYITSQSWYGGAYSGGVTHPEVNHYSFFTDGTQQWIVINTEFCPRAGVITWLQGLLATYSTDEAIIFSHGMLTPPGTLGTSGPSGTSGCYLNSVDGVDDPTAAGGNDIWNAVKSYPNVVMLIGGHFVSGSIYTAYEQLTGTSGNPVLAMYFNHQADGTGNGWIRYITVNPTAKTISTTTYNPWLHGGTSLTDPANQYTVSYAPLSPATLTSVSISPVGAVIVYGTTWPFAATCHYSNGTSDDCTGVGGVTWGTSSTTNHYWTVTTGGVVTAAVDPGTVSNGSGGFLKFLEGYVTASAGGLSTRAGLATEKTTSTMYQYLTPQYNGSFFQQTNSSNVKVQQPLNVVVGTTVSIGSFVNVDASGFPSTGSNAKMQDVCAWSSSNPSVFTVDQNGHATAVASSGTANIICTLNGDGVYGSSTQTGWQASGTTPYITLTAVAGGTGTNTWYVRPNGGTVYSAGGNTSGQCDGLHDADYSGTGINQACAAGNLRYLYADGVHSYVQNWLISGGDTVIVRQNSAGYEIGYDNPAKTQPVNLALSFMNTIPSGTEAQPTRILGENYGNCAADSQKTLLLVSGFHGLNITDSQYVDLECFHLIDEEQCMNNSSYNHACIAGVNLGMSNGVQQSALSASDTYTDLFIDGSAGDGIDGGTGIGVVGTRVHIRGGYAGINMDDDPWVTGSVSVAGGYELDYSLIEGASCVFEYPTVHAWGAIECRDQQLTGYGDGLGTAAANGIWIFIGDVWRWNYQDGLDLLHSGLQFLGIYRNQSYGNIGQTYKIGSGQMVVFQNNLALANCWRVDQPILDSDPAWILPGMGLCRANDNIPIQFDAQGTDIIEGNTIGGYQSVIFDQNCNFDSCATANTTLTGNLIFGMESANNPDYRNQLPQLFYPEVTMPPNLGWVNRSYNLYYNVKTACPSLLTGEVCADPLLVNEGSLISTPVANEPTLDNFNFCLTRSSPAFGTSTPIAGLTVDNGGNYRPTSPSIGGTDCAPPWQGTHGMQGLSGVQ